MYTLTPWTPFRELDEVQHCLGSFFTVLFAPGSGTEFYKDFSQTNERKEPEMPSGIIR